MLLYIIEKKTMQRKIYNFETFLTEKCDKCEEDEKCEECGKKECTCADDIDNDIDPETENLYFYHQD